MKPVVDPAAAKLWTLSANDMEDDSVVSRPCGHLTGPPTHAPPCLAVKSDLRFCLFNFMCMSVCLSICVYGHYMHAWRSQRTERVSDPLEPELSCR